MMNDLLTVEPEKPHKGFLVMLRLADDIRSICEAQVNSSTDWVSARARWETLLPLWMAEHPELVAKALSQALGETIIHERGINPEFRHTRRDPLCH